MSKKKKYTDPIETPENEEGLELYKIKKDAVSRLVNASKESSPKVSDEEIAKYKGKKKFAIPNTLKCLLIKWWFAGAFCFFFLWGLGTVLEGWDLLFVFGAALGILTDLLTNNVLKFIEPEERANDKFMMVTLRKVWSLFINVPYAFLLLTCVYFTYGLLTLVYTSIPAFADQTFGVGPVLFGVFYVLYDMFFILIKNTFIKIFKDAMEKNRR